MPSLAIIHRDEIIEGLASGKRLSDIGLPITRAAISKVLHSDPEYREAVITGMHVRLDTAEKAIEDSVDGVDVARARERFRAVGWRAEREAHERWAPQSNVKLSGAVGVIMLDPEQMLIETARAMAYVLDQAERSQERLIGLEDGAGAESVEQSTQHEDVDASS